MADINKELRDYLASVPAIQAIVGSGADARVYQDYARQEQRTPFIVIAEQVGSVLDVLEQTTERAKASFAVMSMSDTRDKANELSELVRINLTAFHGRLMGAVWVDEVFPENFRSSGVEAAKDDSQQHRYWTQNLYTIHHAVQEVQT